MAMIFISSLARHDLRAEFEAAPAVPLPPEQIVGTGQHFANLQLSGLGQPAMEDFEEEIALEIDKDRLGILVAPFRAASPQRLFARADVSVARPFLLRAQTLNRQNKVVRDPSVIALPQLFQRNRHRTAL